MTKKPEAAARMVSLNGAPRHVCNLGEAVDLLGKLVDIGGAHSQQGEFASKDWGTRHAASMASASDRARRRGRSSGALRQCPSEG